MVIDIKMCRFDNVPWGFRLVGGADYDYPLTVVKVAEGSIAEEAGLLVEDVIVRINDTAAMPLTHDEAHRLILSSGSVFYFGVYRENEEEELAEGPRRFPVNEGSLTKSTPGTTPTPERSATASVSASPLPSLTEATKALIPEQEQVEVAQQLEELECCRSAATPATTATPATAAMTEMHSHGHDNDMAEGQEQEEPTNVNAMAFENEDRQYMPELPDRPCSAMSERAEIKLVEKEIAAVLSGESEVLKEHNVLGILPKPGVCMSSDLLRSINAEVTKTKLEKEKENRKWSTFLQRPDRPVPKSKQQLEAERRAANAYKVKIVKSAPRDKSPMPEAKPKEATPPPVKEATPPKEEVPEEPVEEEPLPTDSEVPNLEQLPDNGNNNEQPEDAEGEQLEKADASKEEKEDSAENADEEQQTAPAETSPAEPNEPTPPPTPVKSDEELALEKQLADVQKQLAALSTLPSTIQSTLDAVTKQLAELLPTFKLQQKLDLPQIDGQALAGEPEDMSDVVAGKPESEQEPEQQELEQVDNGGKVTTAACENNEDKCDANDLKVPEISHSNGDNRQQEETNQEMDQPNEEQCFKKQKKHNVIEELQEHLVRKNNPKRSKRAFGPLTPSSERPLVLPGGRRWYRPKDAYNDEFIAETLSAQAELITGSTLGCPYESPLLGYDPRELQSLSVAKATHRVNFMKYQKPERRVDYNRSEVYKVIHHLDRAPIRGIEVRAPLVAAESDIRQSLQS